MPERRHTRLGLRILDEQLVDSTGRRVGRVEDLELDGGIGERARVTAILCGATAWKRRLPPPLSDAFPGDGRLLRRVPWSEVAKIANEIELRSPEDDLQRASDTEAGALCLSAILGRPVLDPRRGNLGRVREIVAVRDYEDRHEDLPEGERNPWEIRGLLVGVRGLLLRAGFVPELPEELAHEHLPIGYVDWARVQRMDDQGRLVLRPADG